MKIYSSLNKDTTNVQLQQIHVNYMLYPRLGGLYLTYAGCALFNKPNSRFFTGADRVCSFPDR